MGHQLTRIALISCLSSGIALSGCEKKASPTIVSAEEKVRSELAELVNGNGDSARSLAGLAVAVLRGGELSFEATFGRAYIDPKGMNDRVLTPESLIRIASISKTLSAVVVMQLVDEGLLELDRDVSDYLGWELRNPAYPDRPITLRQLLAHVSSIKDAGESYIIRYPRALQEAFDPVGPDFDERFQTAMHDTDRGPGEWYEYANLNFGVIGTVLEKVTGERFDVLMQKRIFEPLSLPGGFNVANFSDSERQSLATLYRKRDRDGNWNPEGDWIPQTDDLSSGVPTALPEGADYVPGTNGAQFSPQGGARLSLRGLETLARLFISDGSIGGVRMLSPNSMMELRHPVWQPEVKNSGESDHTSTVRTAGMRVLTGQYEGDRLFAGDERRWIGHFGTAYGLMAGVWVDPETGDGIVFAITGTAFDPDADPAGGNKPIRVKVLNQLGVLLK